MSIIKHILKPFSLGLFKIKWRKNNRHNNTHAINQFHFNHVDIGKETYGPIEVLYDNGSGFLSIGNYCSIAQGVKFLLGGGHNYKRISTYPFQTLSYKGLRSKKRDSSIDIIVEDDVWIGFDTIVLAGAKIGKGSVIGARSIVTGLIPPYSVYVGNKVIKKRFSDDIIKKIEGIDFSDIRHVKGDAYQEYFDCELHEDNVDVILKTFTEKIE